MSLPITQVEQHQFSDQVLHLGFNHKYPEVLHDWQMKFHEPSIGKGFARQHNGTNIDQQL